MQIKKNLNLLKNNLYALKNDYLLKLIDTASSLVSKSELEVLFIGKVSTGKTSIINALLNNFDLLPTGIGTTTRTLNIIKKGDKNKIIANYKDENFEELDLNKENIDYLNNKQNISTLIFELENFNFDNIKIIDSPGIDDLDTELEKITLSKLLDADIVVFTLDISKGVTNKDYEFFSNSIIKLFDEKIFVVFNKLDTVEEELSSEDLNNISSKLGNYNKFFVSVKNYINGKDNNNFEEFKESFFSNVSKIDKNTFIKNKIRNILEQIKEFSNKQVNTILENKEKDQESLLIDIKNLEKNKEDVEIYTKELEEQTENILQVFYKEIENFLTNKKDEAIRQLNDSSSLKEYLELIKETSNTLKSEIRSLINKLLIDKLNSEEYKKILGGIDFYIPYFEPNHFVDIIANLSEFDPIKNFFQKENIYNLQKIKNKHGDEIYDIKDHKIKDVIIDFFKSSISQIPKNILISDIENFYSNLKKSIKTTILKSKNDLFEEIKMKNFGNIDNEIFSLKKTIETKSLSKDEIDYQIDFYKNKIENINNIIKEIIILLE